MAALRRFRFLFLLEFKHRILEAPEMRPSYGFRGWRGFRLRFFLFDVSLDNWKTFRQNVGLT